MDRTMMSKERLYQRLPLHLVKPFLESFTKCEKAYGILINRYEVQERDNSITVHGYDKCGVRYTVSNPVTTIPRSEIDSK